MKKILCSIIVSFLLQPAFPVPTQAQQSIRVQDGITLVPQAVENVSETIASAIAVFDAETEVDIEQYLTHAFHYFWDKRVTNAQSATAQPLDYLFPAYAATNITDFADVTLGTADDSVVATVASTSSMGLALIVLCIGHARGLIDTDNNERDEDQLVRHIQGIVDFFDGADRATATAKNNFFLPFYVLSDGTAALANVPATLGDPTVIRPIDTALLVAGLLYAREYLLEPAPGDSPIVEADDNDGDNVIVDINTLVSQASINWSQVLNIDDNSNPDPDRFELSFINNDPADGFEFQENYDRTALVHYLSINDRDQVSAKDAWNALDTTAIILDEYLDDNDQYSISVLEDINGTESAANVTIDFIDIAGEGLVDHLLSQSVIDFRQKQDEAGIDYFLNSVRAVLANRTYAFNLAQGIDIDDFNAEEDENPFFAYQMGLWGLTKAFTAAEALSEIEAFTPDADIDLGDHNTSTNNGTVTPNVTMAAINHAPLAVIRFFKEAQAIDAQLVADNQASIFNQYGFVGSFSFGSADVELRNSAGTKPALSADQESAIDAILRNPLLTLAQKEQQIKDFAQANIIAFANEVPTLDFNITSTITSTVSSLDKALEVIMIENFLREQDQLNDSSSPESVWDYLQDNGILNFNTSETTLGISALAAERNYLDSTDIGSVVDNNNDGDTGNDNDNDNNQDNNQDNVNNDDDDDEDFITSTEGGLTLGAAAGATVGLGVGVASASALAFSLGIPPVAAVVGVTLAVAAVGAGLGALFGSLF